VKADKLPHIELKGAFSGERYVAVALRRLHLRRSTVPTAMIARA